MLQKKYVKINSLWKRQGWYFDEGKKKSPEYQKGRQSFIEGDYSCPEFGNIKKWHVEEKIDGTNIRVIYKDGKVSFGGRTENSQLPPHLLKYLQDTLKKPLVINAFPDEEEVGGSGVILFGEGYGPKIQSCGENYRKNVGFILFDVLVGGCWLKREDVAHIALALDIPMCPTIGIMEEKEIVEFVKTHPKSLCSEIPQTMEGVICRPEVPMLFRDGSPIIWKLKCKEFALCN